MITNEVLPNRTLQELSIMSLVILQDELTFNFDLLSIGFVSFIVFVALENVVGFTKTRFYQKRSSVTMHNYVETFHTNVDHNLA